MEDKKLCPKCHKPNDIHKFCVYCGQKLLDDEQIRLILDNPEPYCLNCGRTVKKGQTKCECGYEFRIIDCPKCNSKNSYTNRFCTICGKKLWTSDVCEINYSKIKSGIIIDRFPHEMRNTILHSRYKIGHEIQFPDDIIRINDSNLQAKKSRVENHLSEILSRWKIVSPHYCINCFNIMKADEYLCQKCKTTIPYAERVDQIKNKKYNKPVFDMVELKWNSKFSKNYLNSLAPAIGESQFEYRERLKWEFAENNKQKNIITTAINHQNKLKKHEEKRERQIEAIKKRRELEREYMRLYGGGYCSSDCIYCYEEIITNHGVSADYTSDICGVNYYCRLGYYVSEGRFCKYYK